MQQSEGIVLAVEIGQSVNEEVNSLQKEYQATDQNIRANMKERNQTLRSLRTDIDNIRLQGQAIQHESHAALLPHQVLLHLHLL